MRDLLRLVVADGTGRNADVPGYEVGGKTGTAEKPGRHGYRDKALISSFVGVFPMREPRYVIMVSMDEPKGIKETGGYATGGAVAAPSVRAIIERIVTLYGIQPVDPVAAAKYLAALPPPAPAPAAPAPVPAPTPAPAPVAAQGRPPGTAAATATAPTLSQLVEAATGNAAVPKPPAPGGR
jgi:cell division protein FtsI (penicillin-binding protein 3)